MLKIITRLSDMDLDKLFGLYCDAQNCDPEDCRRSQNALYDYLAQVFFRTEGAYYAVWEACGSYVSALRLEPYMDGLLLSALETAPQHRNSGYATKLMQAALAQVRLPVYSHVNKKNRASCAVHHSCGFQRLKGYAVYVDGSVSQDAYTLLRVKAD